MSPRFQRAEAKPMKVTKAKKMMKTVRAVVFNGMARLSPSTRLVARFGRVIGGRRHDHADEYPAELEPIEEGKAEQRRFDPVVERHPEDEEGNQQQPQHPMFAVAARFAIGVHSIPLCSSWAPA